MGRALRKNSSSRQRHREVSTPANLPPIVCARCGSPLVRGQHVAPVFAARLVRWSEHPVLSKAPVIRGLVPSDGSPGRSDLSLAEQLRQRAAMGGERERAELAAFEKLMARWIADALVAHVREEADAAGVDPLTWLSRDRAKDEV